MNEINLLEPPSHGYIEELIKNAVKQLEKLGYQSGTMQNYRRTWKEFSLFAMESSSENTFTTELVCQFLESHGIFLDKVDADLSFRQQHIRNVMHVLTDFVMHGCIQRHNQISKKIKLPDNMEEFLFDYEKFCYQQSLSPLGTIRSRMRDIARFLHYLDAHGIATLEGIQASTVFHFVSSCAHLKPATLAHIVSSIRSFLRYLCMSGFINNKLVENVPTVRVRPDHRIPSV